MSLFRRDDEDPALFAALVEQAGMANHLWVLADRLRKPTPDVLDLAKGLELVAAYLEPTARKVAPITAPASPVADEQTPELGPGKPQDPSLDGWVLVPREATDKMLWAYELPNIDPDELAPMWNAMISAAPPFPLLGDEYSSSATEHSASRRPATPLSAGKED